MRATPRIEARNRRWFPRHRAAHEVYLELVRELVDRRRPILHLGAGRDSLGVVQKLPGVRFVSLDVDSIGLRRNLSQCRVLADAERTPFRAGVFGTVLCENVFEHLEAPDAVLWECYRVLARGGRLVFLCPNRMSYISLVAAATSHRWHRWFKRTLLEVPEGEVFATHYRLNTARRISTAARRTGFTVDRVVSSVGWPTYWEFSDLAHRIAVVIHWLIERGPALFHVTLVGVLGKDTEEASVTEKV